MLDAPAPPRSTDPPIGVMIVEDQPEIRDCLRVLFDGTPGYRCVGSFRTMEAALGALASSAPDVALVDIGLPGMSGIEGIGRMREARPQTVGLILSVHDDDERIFAAICAGARGYLLKRTPPARLLEGIREAMGGGAPMSPEVARRVVDAFRTRPLPSTDDADLTPHERRLLKLLVDGHTYRTAAAELGVTVHAVSFHLRSIYEKLHVHSKTEAVAKALRHRLLE
jgi:DNA-binding NarL/FixJ family response regulator